MFRVLRTIRNLAKGLGVAAVPCILMALFFVFAFHQCSCPNGIGAYGPRCPMTHSNLCVSCSQGYMLTAHTCVVNRCTCKHGKRATGLFCLQNGTESCIRCDSGFQLNGKTCTPIPTTTTTTATTTTTTSIYSFSLIIDTHDCSEVFFHLKFCAGGTCAGNCSALNVTAPVKPMPKCVRTGLPSPCFRFQTLLVQSCDAERAGVTFFYAERAGRYCKDPSVFGPMPFGTSHCVKCG